MDVEGVDRFRRAEIIRDWRKARKANRGDMENIMALPTDGASLVACRWDV